MSVKDRAYRPSPSQLGACPRALVYWGLEFPETPRSKLSELRALRGTAIHRAFPEIFEQWLNEDPKPQGFEDLQGYTIIGHEVAIPVKYGKIETTGTVDLLVELEWGDGKTEMTVWDCKNYASLPKEPYDSNVLQIEAYLEACVLKFGVTPRKCEGWSGYLFYFPDSGLPKAFRVPRNPGINALADGFFGEVAENIEARTFPKRLDYSDHRCGWCGFFQECWGGVLEEAGIVPGEAPVLDPMLLEDEDLISTLTEQISVRRTKGELTDQDKTLTSKLIRKFAQYHTDRFALGDGQVSLYKRLSSKGLPYYVVKYSGLDGGEE